jgi:PAS domain S-box-containing protein
MKILIRKWNADRFDLSALLITALYLLAGGLWIPSSDYLAAWISQGSHERLTQISIYKGWGYVLVTGVLLYLLIHINNRSLQHANHSYLLLAENISDVVWILDIEDGRFTHISPSIKSLRGLTPEEAMRESPQQALLPESWAYLNSVLPARIADFQNGVDRAYTDELAQPRRDGSTVWVEVTSRFVLNKHSGRLEAYAVSRDITERRQAREELKRSEVRFHSAFDTMLEGCQIIGSDWRYLYLNAAAERHNRRPAAELLGQRYQDAWPGVEETQTFAAMQRCLLEQTPTRLENHFIHPDGQESWFDLSIQPVPEGLFILSLDISERVQAERQAAQMTRLYAVLSQVNQTIVRVRDRDELFRALCAVSAQFGGFALAWVSLLD